MSLADKEISLDVIFTVYDWFESSMNSAGVKTKKTKCNDWSKTYQFRAVKSYVNKCYKEFMLSDDMVKLLTNNIVLYAKKKKLLSKGAQMLCMSAIVDICYKSLQQVIDSESELFSELEYCSNFMLQQWRNVDDAVDFGPNGNLRKLVLWYKSGQITATYLALSKRCLKAYHKIPEFERYSMPNSYELLKICSSTVNSENIDDIKKIMGNDLRIPPDFNS